MRVIVETGQRTHREKPERQFLGQVWGKQQAEERSVLLVHALERSLSDGTGVQTNESPEVPVQTCGDRNPELRRGGPQRGRRRVSI